MERPAADLSTLEITVDLPYTVIERELNKAIPKKLYSATGQQIDDCPVSECFFEVRVLRNGKISVGRDRKGGVVVNLPIRAGGRIDAMQNLGFKVRKHANFSASVTATVTLQFAMQPNWSVVPTAKLVFHVRQAKVRVSFPVVGKVEISVRGKMTELLKRQRNKLQRKLVEALKGKVDFRSDAASAWSQLHASRRLSDQPPIWLVADPVSLRVENPKAEDSGLRLLVGIGAYLSIRVQQETPDAPDPEALPNLKVVPKMEGRYKLSLPIRISVGEFNQQIDNLIDKEYIFSAAGKKIAAKLLDGRVYTNGPDVVVYVKVRAASVAYGVFPLSVGAYLNGTPRYDAGSKTVYLDRFDYDADTNNFLLNKAEWYFQSAIRENLQTTLRLDISEEIDRAHQLIEEKLRNVRLSKHVTMQGTLDRFNPRAIYAATEAINVDVLAEGQVKVVLK